MVSRHDVVAWVVEVVGGFLFDSWAAGEGDMIEVSIEPDASWEGFTWGVVKKGKMRRLKEARYDLVFPLLILRLGVWVDGVVWNGRLTSRDLRG